MGVTSAVYGEGKTTVAMNLAGTIAQNSPQRVALVDANLRNWDLQTRLNLPPCTGLVDILEGGEDDLTNVIQKTELDNFTIVPAGRAAANPYRLARSPRLQEVMGALRMANEFIVMDMAPDPARRRYARSGLDCGWHRDGGGGRRDAPRDRAARDGRRRQ